MNLKTIWNNVCDSFTNSKTGFAARKLTAFTVIGLVVYCHIRYVDITNVVQVIIIDYFLIAFMLGLVTFEQILKFKNGQKDEPAS